MGSHDGFDALEPVRNIGYFRLLFVSTYVVSEGTAYNEQDRDWDYEFDAAHNHDDSVLLDAVIGVRQDRNW